MLKLGLRDKCILPSCAFFKFHLIWGPGIWQALSMQRRHACAFGADLGTALHPLSASGTATRTPAHIPLKAAGSPYHIASYRITEQSLCIMSGLAYCFSSHCFSLSLLFRSLFLSCLFLSNICIHCISNYSFFYLVALVSGRYGVLFEWECFSNLFFIHRRSKSVTALCFIISIYPACVLTSFTFPPLRCITTFPPLHGRISHILNPFLCFLVFLFLPLLSMLQSDWKTFNTASPTYLSQTLSHPALGDSPTIINTKTLTRRLNDKNKKETDLNSYTVDSSIGAKCCPLNYGRALELVSRNEAFHKRKCHREDRDFFSEKSKEDRGHTMLLEVIIFLARLLVKNSERRAELTRRGSMLQPRARSPSRRWLGSKLQTVTHFSLYVLHGTYFQRRLHGSGHRRNQGRCTHTTSKTNMDIEKWHN